jgi:hypothetical protein
MAAFTAIWQKHDVNAVKSLLDRGVNPNAKDANGSTLIHYAVTNNQVDIARLLIDRGADIHDHHGKDGHTVLHLAVLHEDGEMTKLLLDNKANPNVRDNLTYTPLHVSILRENTPYTSIRSYYGLNDLSSKKASIKSIQYLLVHGADVDAIGGITEIRGKAINISDGLEFTGVSISSKIETDPFEAVPLMPEGTPMRLDMIKYNRIEQSLQDEEAQKILKVAGGKYLSCEREKEHRICRLTAIAPPLSKGTAR